MTRPPAPSGSASPDTPHVVVVEDVCHGMRLRDFLQRHWPEVDRVFLRQLLADGAVRVVGDVAGPLRPLRRGDAVELELPCAVAELPRFGHSGEPADLVVLHEDEELLCVAKPAGLACRPHRAGKHEGALGLLRRVRSDRELHLVYRIEREASGCLLFAKTAAVADRLQGACAGGGMEIAVWALVQGRPRWRQRQVVAHLGPDPHRPGRICTVPATARGARPAETGLEVVETFRDHALVEARPRTLRNHQVRVHLGFLGHPVVADRDYGVRRELLLSDVKKRYKARRGVVERPLLTRMFVHVERVRLPRDRGEPLVVACPLPEDLAVVLAKLRKFAAVP